MWDDRGRGEGDIADIAVIGKPKAHRRDAEAQRKPEIGKAKPTTEARRHGERPEIGKPKAHRGDAEARRTAKVGERP